MKVSELISKLMQFDQNKEVGGLDHYGSILNIESVSDYGDLIYIEIEPKGDEPD
jgi:hypothetical protein